MPTVATCDTVDSASAASGRDRPQGRSARARAALAAVLLGSLLPGAGAEAKVVRCAGSVQDILDAVATINATPTQSFDLRIRSGFFALPLPYGHGSVHAIFRIDRTFNVTGAGEGSLSRISGAWNDDCSVQAVAGAAATATVLDGQSSGPDYGVPILSVIARPIVPPVQHTIRIDRLTFYRAGPNVQNQHLLDATNALYVQDYTDPSSLNVELDRISVDSTRGAPAVEIGSRSVSVRNSLFVRNVGVDWDFGADSLGPALYLAMPLMAEVRNNTFRYNTPGYDFSTGTWQPVFWFRAGEDGSEPSAILRNLFADNQVGNGYEISATSSSLAAGGIIVDNRVGSLAHGVSATTRFETSGTTDVNPGFTSAFTYTLSAGSALCDYGNFPAWTSPGELDYYGNIRLAGARPEPGAVEQPACSTSIEIMSDGFES